MTPKAPNPPICTLLRSKPATFLTTIPPARTTRPSPVTTVVPRTWSRTGPNRWRSPPAVAVARTEPNVRSGDPGGSIASQVRCPANRPPTARMVAPAWTVATRSAGATEVIRSSRSVLTARSAGASAGIQVRPPSTRTIQCSSDARPRTAASPSIESGVTRGRPSRSSDTAGPRADRRRPRMPGVMSATRGNSGSEPPCQDWRTPRDRTPAAPRTWWPAWSDRRSSPYSRSCRTPPHVLR